MEYTLIRSKRKTVAIYVRGKIVEVRAPLKMAKQDIDRFVASRERWIADKLAITSERAEKRESFTLNYGSELAYCGRQYPIEAKEGNSIGFDGERFYMPSGLTPEEIKAGSVHVYRMLAKRDLTNRTVSYARMMAVDPAAVKISDARTRWGSCSGKKSINYSWRLVMADEDIIDYIVVHELAHLTEMNHSERFWKIVESILPDYSERRARLKEWQRKLTFEPW